MATRKKATDATASVKAVMAEAEKKGYLGEVPDETPNSVYAMPYPGSDGAPDDDDADDDADDDNNP